MKWLLLLIILAPVVAAAQCHVVSEGTLRCKTTYFVPANSTQTVDIWLKKCTLWANPTSYIGLVQSDVQKPGVIVQEVISACIVPFSRIAVTNTTDSFQHGNLYLTYQNFARDQ